MCLRVHRQKQVLLAKEPIKVFKLLEVKGPGKGESPFRYAKYQRGEEYSVGAFTGWSDNDLSYTSFNTGKIGQYQDIYQGIHAYTNLRAAAHVRSDYNGEIIVACTIPVGTPYIRGYGGEIVALRLRIGRAVGKSNLAQLFNTPVKRSGKVAA